MRLENISRIFEDLFSPESLTKNGEEGNRANWEIQLDAILQSIESLATNGKQHQAMMYLRELLQQSTETCLENVSQAAAKRIKDILFRTALQCERAEAKEIAQLIIDFDPKEARAYCLMGDLLTRAGESDKAREFWQRAKALQPDYVDPLLALARYYSERGMIAEGLREYLQLIERQPTPVNYWRVNRELESLGLTRLNVSSNQRIKIGLVSSFTIDPVTYYLRVKCLQCGIFPEFFVSRYGQHIQSILNPDSELYRFQPDLVFLMARLENLIPELSNPERDVQPGQILTQVLEKISLLTEEFARNSDALLIIHNFLSPTFTTNGILENKQRAGLRRVIAEINRELEDSYRENKQVFILDYDHLAGCFGRLRCRDARRFYLADMEWADEFLPLLADHYLSYIKPFKGILRKCIVLDLDQTLWGGILGESGFDGIQLDVNPPGKEFRDFQRLLLEFYERGIILAINSRNNFEEAIAVIRDHPYMILREKHFAAIRINWQDKVLNMRSIAQELNIGLDSMVFIDDSPVERLYMKQALPEVLTLDLPDDPALYRSTLEQLNDFSVLSLTEEDMKRGEIYAAQYARERLRENSVSYEDFLANLKMTLTIRQADSFSMARVAQLTNRTNQFNLTTRRYTEQEIASFCEDPSFGVYTLQVSDIFGDNGLVGIAVIKKYSEDCLWEFDSFLMSCRVLGRRLETCFLHTLLKLAQEKGIRMIRGDFIPTGKNEVARDFYRDHGFTLIQEENGTTRWEMELKGSVFATLDWVVIQLDNGHN